MKKRRLINFGLIILSHAIRIYNFLAAVADFASAHSPPFHARDRLFPRDPHGKGDAILQTPLFIARDNASLNPRCRTRGM